MKIKLCYISSNNSQLLTLAVKLTNMGITPILDNQIIQFEGRSINIEAYEQIRSRDPKNPQVTAFKKLLMEVQLEKIKKSNGLLVVNNYSSNSFPPHFYYEIFSAFVLNLPIFFLNSYNSELICFDEFNAMGIYILNEDLSKIQDVIKSNIEEKISTSESILNPTKTRKLKLKKVEV